MRSTVLTHLSVNRITIQIKQQFVMTSQSVNQNNIEFIDGERVLCFHGPLIYEAKCLKTQIKDKQHKYYIHYLGWNKNWDEWVPDTRVLKYNEQNLKLQQELKTKLDPKLQTKTGSKRKNNNNESNECQQMPQTSLQSSSSTTTTTTAITAMTTNHSPNNVTRSKTQQNVTNNDNNSNEKSSETGKDNTIQTQNESQNKKKRQTVPAFVETEEQFNTKLEIKIKIPEELKPWLVDDWDLITRQKKLVQLPARITVDAILDDYMKHKTLSTKMTQLKESALNEVICGIKDYFNIMLGSQLLYKFERTQYQNQLQEHPKDTRMSSIYGSIHLLRLFVKLGNMLSFTSLDHKCSQILLSHVHDFLKYLTRNLSFFSLNDYIIASPEYYRKTI